MLSRISRSLCVLKLNKFYRLQGAREAKIVASLLHKFLEEKDFPVHFLTTLC